MKTKSKWTEQRDEFFVIQFNKYFADWKSKDKKTNTQGEFARQICEIRNRKTGEKCPVTNSYVSEWKRGVWFPEQYLPEIAEVLGVKEEDFFFNTHEDQYRYSSEYMTTKIGEQMIIPYSEEIGLDIDFLHITKKLIGSDFENVFPFWTPLDVDVDHVEIGGKNMSEDIKQFYTYKHLDRSVLPESAPMINKDGTQSEYAVFQTEVDIDGSKKLITMTDCDLKFLRDVQEEVKVFIEFLFMKRKKEMDHEGEDATRRAISHTETEEGGSISRSVRYSHLNAEELTQIDKYGVYIDPKTHRKKV